MEIKQQLKLSQQLVMTPQLQQAIRLLQLSRLELIDEIRKELDANPVLADEEIDPRARANGDAKNGEAINEPPAPDSPAMASEKADVSRPREARRRRSASRRSTGSSSSRTARSSSRCPATAAATTSSRPSSRTSPRALRSSTTCAGSCSSATSPTTRRRFAELVLGNLDDNGFLDLKGIERENGEKTPGPHDRRPRPRGPAIDPEDAECVLREMQEWDPVGVCSRDHSRSACTSRPRCFGYDDLELAIIDKHLDNLEKHNYQAIARDLKVTVEEVYEAVKQIQKLESRPARNFTRDRRQDDRHHARRLRHQGRRQVRRHRQRPRRAAPLHQRVAHQAAPQGPAGQGVHRREAPQRAVADPRDRAAAQDDHPGDRVHRRQAARLLREGRRATSSR